MLSAGRKQHQIYKLGMGICQSKQEDYRNQSAKIQRTKKTPSITPPSHPLKQSISTNRDDLPQHPEEFEIAERAIEGRKTICVDFSPIFTEQALLVRPKSGERVDRRELTCAGCIGMFPSNCIGLIQAEYSNPLANFSCQSKGTGFMISNSLVLTSCHLFCQINPLTKEVLTIPPKKLFLGLTGQVVDGQQRNLSSQNFFAISDFRINQNFVTICEKIGRIQKIIEDSKKACSLTSREQALTQIYDLKVESERHDFALVKLARPTKLKKHFKLNPLFSKKGANVKVQGCEMEKVDHKRRNLKQMFHVGAVKEVRSYSLYYDVDTQNQQSGSPVLGYEGGRMEVVGIHKGYASRVNLNVGTRVTMEVVNQLSRWASQMDVLYDYEIEGDSHIHVRHQLQLAMDNNKYKIKQEHQHELKEKQQLHQNQALALQNKLKEKDQTILKQEEEILKLKQALSQEDKGKQQNSPVITKAHSQQVLNKKQVRTYQFKTSVRRMQWLSSNFKSLKVERNTATLLQDNLCQVVSQKPIQPNAKYTLRLNKYGGDYAIIVGVITEARKNQKWSGGSGECHEESVGYWSDPKHKDGMVFVDGKCKVTAASFVPEGHTISLVYNPSGLSVTFQVAHSGGQWKAELPGIYKIKPLYLFATLYDKDTSVQLSC